MKELKSYKTAVYESGKYLVYITEKRDMYDAWLSRKDYGIMNYMFGCPKKQTTLDGREWETDYEGFCEMVENNLLEYKRIYEEEHEE